MRLQRLPLLATPVIALALVLPTPSMAASTPPAAPSKAPLADLNAAVERTAAELTEGTVRLEQGQARLDQLIAQTAAARAGAAAAALRAADTTARLGDLVGAAYRSPDPDRLSLVLAAGQDITDTLRATATLEHAQGRQSDLAAQATVDRQRADLAVQEATSLEAAATEQAQELARQVAALQEQAEQARVRLEAAAATQRAAQAERAAAAAAAAERASRDRGVAAPAFVPGAVGPGCGGGSLGGYANGMLPASALCPLNGTNGLLLRADAAAAFNRMAAAGGMPCAGNSYRSYGEQVALYRVKPSLAAVPGTSNHGWGVAVDFACGADRYGSAGYQWLKANGPKFGWTHPSWAEPGGNRPEPWHWEFTG